MSLICSIFENGWFMGLGTSSRSQALTWHDMSSWGHLRDSQFMEFQDLSCFDVHTNRLESPLKFKEVWWDLTTWMDLRTFCWVRFCISNKLSRPCQWCWSEDHPLTARLHTASLSVIYIKIALGHYTSQVLLLHPLYSIGPSLCISFLSNPKNSKLKHITSIHRTQFYKSRVINRPEHLYFQSYAFDLKWLRNALCNS